MKPISLDLRHRILAALKEEGPSLVVAKRFRVGASSVRKLRLQMLRTGSFEPGTAPGRERLVQGQDEERLLRLVWAYPDATLNVLRELLLDETGVSVSETTMWRQLERMGITLKKDNPRVRTKPTGCDRGTSEISRIRPLENYVPGGRWETYSIIAGLRSTGVIAPMMIPGAMNTAALLTWVEVVLAPTLQRGDIVIWDNLRIHSEPEVVRAIKARGARLEFTPPYSPEFNPIEEAWSTMKAILRAAKARTVSELLEFLRDALRAISPADCRGWFEHAGYTVPDPCL